MGSLMSDVANVGDGLPSEAPQGRRRGGVMQPVLNTTWQFGETPPPTAGRTQSASVPMDTFRWIVSGLLGTLVLGVGWFLSGIQADLRDVRKEVTSIRVEAAVTNTRLEELIAEFRRHNSR